MSPILGEVIDLPTLRCGYYLLYPPPFIAGPRHQGCQPGLIFNRCQIFTNWAFPGCCWRSTFEEFQKCLEFWKSCCLSRCIFSVDSFISVWHFLSAIRGWQPCLTYHTGQQNFPFPRGRACEVQTARWCHLAYLFTSLPPSSLFFLSLLTGSAW